MLPLVVLPHSPMNRVVSIRNGWISNHFKTILQTCIQLLHHECYGPEISLKNCCSQNIISWGLLNVDISFISKTRNFAISSFFVLMAEPKAHQSYDPPVEAKDLELTLNFCSSIRSRTRTLLLERTAQTRGDS